MDEKTNTAMSKEIDIVKLVSQVLREYRLLAGFMIVFALLGIVVALSTPKTFTTEVVLAPEMRSGIGLSGNLLDLASMVGVDLSGEGKNVDAIYPEIYPDVFASTDFIVKLFDVKVKTKDGRETTYFNHLAYDKNIPFWSDPSVWLSKLMASKNKAASQKRNLFQLSKKEHDIAALIRDNISCTVDKRTSVITIAVKDDDAMTSAIVADTLRAKLQEYITLYRTKKARNDLAYVERLYREAKAQYEKSRQHYGSYADANTDVTLESFKAKQEDLENEMQLRFNAYAQMAQQLQLAKAKVQEKTPAFTIIQNASVPLRASSISRIITVIIYMILGVLVDALWVLWLRGFYRSFKKG